MKTLNLTVNGKGTSAAVEPRTHLADFLREDCLLTGTHLGCEHGVCGACTVLKDGRPVRSCLTYAVSCEGASVQSIEGLDDDPLMVRLRDSFSAEHALQCGYCTPGMLVTARDIVQRFAGQSLSDARLRQELSGNLCRCTGYTGIVKAIQRVLRQPEELPIASAPASTLTALQMDHYTRLPLEEGAMAGPAAAASSSDGDGRRIEAAFELDHPSEAVWRALRDDIQGTVACMPGLELRSVSETGEVDGVFHVGMGPISARIAGEGRVVFDDAACSGRVEGAGKDGGSGSRARGSVTFTVQDAGHGRSSMGIVMAFELTVALAQFSRGSLVQDIVRLLIEQFRVNLDARLRGEEAPSGKALNPLSLLWLSLRSRFRSWFGKG
ncbi:MAG: 2Fe-2S iron-sulfur cluster binding domain-containing protein [Ectothiorhodospiraceae bacterium]|nr:2Fe-2S iron-sulfur cluster binding domain-containing protein [Ectothiorhodospiraceae bacterium]